MKLDEKDYIVGMATTPKDSKKAEAEAESAKAKSRVTGATATDEARRASAWGDPGRRGNQRRANPVGLLGIRSAFAIGTVKLNRDSVDSALNLATFMKQ